MVWGHGASFAGRTGVQNWQDFTLLVLRAVEEGERGGFNQGFKAEQQWEEAMYEFELEPKVYELDS